MTGLGYGEDQIAVQDHSSEFIPLIWLTLTKYNKWDFLYWRSYTAKYTNNCMIVGQNAIEYNYDGVHIVFVWDCAKATKIIGRSMF